MVKGASRRRCRSQVPRRWLTAPAGGVGVELGAGQVEHVLGPVDHAVRAQGLAEAQRAAAQQPAEGELAGLLLAEDRIALGDLEQRLEPRLQLRPVAKHGQALGGEGFAAGGQLAVVLGWPGWWPAELAGGGVGPVEALDRVGGQVGLAAGQPDQQLLDTGVDGGQVLAVEAGQGAFHLPGRAAHHRQRPQLLAGGRADPVDDGHQLLGRGGLDLLLASGPAAGSGAAARCATLGQAGQQPPVGDHRVAARAQHRIAEEAQQPAAALQQRGRMVRGDSGGVAR